MLRLGGGERRGEQREEENGKTAGHGGAPAGMDAVRIMANRPEGREEWVKRYSTTRRRAISPSSATWVGFICHRTGLITSSDT